MAARNAATSRHHVEPAVVPRTGRDGVAERTQPVSGESGLDDATLAARARDGDVVAFEVLVDRYERPIYRLAVRMLSCRSEAEDVTQDVFMTAWRRLPDLREEAAFVGWLYRTATNRCLNILRGRRPTVSLDAHEPAAAASGQPERVAEAAAATEALTVALRQLTPAQRACWLLREIHGRSYEEIAATVGTTTTAVRGRIARARADLAEAMQPWR